MNWKGTVREYRHWLRVEKGLSENTSEGYLHDLQRYQAYMEEQGIRNPLKVSTNDIRDFIQWLSKEALLNENSLARNISSIRSFHKFLFQEDYTEKDPTELLDVPKLTRKLPVYLTVEEIDRIYAEIDHSTAHGVRNRAMLELLYSSGLRVSELVNLERSMLYMDEGFVRVFGKGGRKGWCPWGNRR